MALGIYHLGDFLLRQDNSREYKLHAASTSGVRLQAIILYTSLSRVG